VAAVGRIYPGSSTQTKLQASPIKIEEAVSLFLEGKPGGTASSINAAGRRGLKAMERVVRRVAIYSIGVNMLDGICCSHMYGTGALSRSSFFLQVVV